MIDTFNRYKFTINENTPIEEEIALDPELLGRVFENLLASYNPETETTARKQTGSFYTPRAIVNYMVDESLVLYLQSKLLTDKTDNVTDRLRHLISYNDESHQFSSDEVSTLINAIDNAKILDPACGSGAFPMGILHKLVFILAKLDPRNERWKQRQIDRVKEAIKTAEQIEDATFRERTTGELEQQIADIDEAFERNELDYGRKLFLIENCIYGVDIQPIACQIAKLRFFISLVVDQKVDDRQLNRGIRPLPNLETKFVAANTLLSVERPTQLVLRNEDIDRKEKQLGEVRRRYLTARSPQTKSKYRAQDKNLRAEIAALLQKDGFPRKTTERLAEWDPYDQNAGADFFDPEWMFGIIAALKTQPSMTTLRGSLSIINQTGGQGELTTIDEFYDGFDIIIGNPPYVRQEEIKEFKPDFKEIYKCFTGVADLYVYFYERSVKLLRTGGVLAFISSNKFFRAGYGGKLRAFLSQAISLKQVIDFGDAPVFTAISYPSIIILIRQRPNGNQPRVLTWQPGPRLEDFASIFEANGFSIRQKELNSDGWRLVAPAVIRLLEKLRRSGTPLGEMPRTTFFNGVKTGLNSAFVLSRAERDAIVSAEPGAAKLFKPFLRGRDVRRWRVQPADLWLLYLPWHFPLHSDGSIRNSSPEAEKAFKARFPIVHKHLKRYSALLSKRDASEVGVRYEWYTLSRPRFESATQFAQPKVVIPTIVNDVEYAVDREGYYSNDKTTLLACENPEFVTALLNSKPLFWFMRQTAAQKQGGFYEFKPMYVSALPIPDATTAQQKPLEGLVERILSAKQRDTKADVSALEREIGELVYFLYGLTREEIAIVEDATSDVNETTRETETMVE